MSFFKAYDMRGTFGTDFDLDLVRRVGFSLPQIVGGARWLVGRDGRTTSPAVRDALIQGLLAAGAEVTDLGLATTPMVYHFTDEDDFDGSVMITASHNPPSDNGLKVSKRGALPVGQANGLDRVELLATTLGTDPTSLGTVPPANRGTVPHAIERYLSWQRAHAPFLEEVNHTLRFAVDCSNGTASLLVRELFPNAIILNDVLDGSFPAHSPNPLKPESRLQLTEAVRSGRLDCGLIFDGDADRAMFVDERGEFVQPDYLIPIVAQATRAVLGRGTDPNGRGTDPNGLGTDPVIHDVRTSRGVIEALREMGCEPIMVPVGHAFAKPALRQSNAICGGELAGHYYFREFHGCDSGILSALRILFEASRAKAQGGTFSQMVAPISSRYANSGERNYRVADKDAAIERVLKTAAERLPREISRSTMDGIRLEFAEGWVNVRKSNTEPFLRLLVECDTSARLAEWIGLLEEAIRP